MRLAPLHPDDRAPEVECRLVAAAAVGAGHGLSVAQRRRFGRISCGSLRVMALTSDARLRLLDEVARAVPSRDTGVRVAVDGVDGAGKTTFADELAFRLRALGRAVVRVWADDFLNPRAVRYQRGRSSPEGFFLDSYDLPSLRRLVLDPLGPGGDRRYRLACHDLAADRPLDVPWHEAPAGAVLVLDGLFLHRDELAGIWDLSVFLQVPFAVSVARLAARDGSPPDPSHPALARYVGGQQLYFDACSPWERADLVVDNSDLHAPVLTARGATSRTE